LSTLPRLYPDNVTNQRIELANEKANNTNYWTKSTQQALKKALDPINLENAQDILCVGHNGCAPDYLDILHDKAPNAHITVVDTQAKQIETMKNYFKNHPPRTPADNYTLFTTADFTKPPETVYDLVLLYHLTNHITLDMTRNFAKTLKDSIKPNGSVVMLTAHDDTGKNGYIDRTIAQAEKTGETIIEDEPYEDGTGRGFNTQLTKKNLSNADLTTLPTRRMHIRTVGQFLKTLGVTLDQLVPFHFKSRDLSSEKNIQEICSEDLKKSDRYGEDIIAVGKKMDTEA
jgi:2-polyprenyl-3-methyl-5-hydroxy-6-metoxy-1,4-benzoquinol methylase